MSGLRRRLSRTSSAQAEHFAPDEGAVASVEVEQVEQVGVAADADVGLDEGGRQVGAAVVLEVHG